VLPQSDVIRRLVSPIVVLAVAAASLVTVGARSGGRERGDSWRSGGIGGDVALATGGRSETLRLGRPDEFRAGKGASTRTAAWAGPPAHAFLSPLEPFRRAATARAPGLDPSRGAGRVRSSRGPPAGDWPSFQS
jgi:hypothetical protein